MRGEEIAPTVTSMLGIESPDTRCVYPRATMEEKRAARASLIFEEITGGAYPAATIRRGFAW